MATNIKYDSTDILTFVAGSARTAGTPALEGNVLVVPLESCDSGAEYAAQVRGRVYIGKTAAQAWTQGDSIYWNAGTSLCHNVQTGTLKQIGQAGAAAANPSSYGYVDLGVGVEADSDIGSLKADLASTAAGKGTALIGDETSGGTLKAKLDTCTTQAAAAAGAGTLPHYAGASRVLADSMVASSDLVTQAAAAAGAGTLPHYAGATKVLADSLVPSADVVTQAAAAAGAGTIPTYAGASKVLQDSTVALSTVPTMAAVGDVSGIIGTATTDRAQSDTLLRYIATLGVGVPSIIAVNTGAADQGIGVFATLGFGSGAPYALEIVDAWVACQAANAGGTITLRTAAAGGGDPITDAMPCAVLNEKGYAGDLDTVGGTNAIAAAGEIYVWKNAAADSGRVFIEAVRTA